MKRFLLISILLCLVSTMAYGDDYLSESFPSTTIISMNLKGKLSDLFTIVEYIGKYKKRENTWDVHLLIKHETGFVEITTLELVRLDTNKWLMFWESHKVVLKK